jgi:hypothetical protein
MPEGLEVGVDLDLSYSEIASLPKGLKVGQNLFIGGTPLAKFSDDELIKMVEPSFLNRYIYR